MSAEFQRTGKREGTALVLSGGGAKGAFQAGAVVALCERYPDFNPDIICGVSVGAINGAKLAEGATDPASFKAKALELEQFWIDLANRDIEVWQKGFVLEKTIRYFKKRISLDDYIHAVWKNLTRQNPLDAVSDEIRETTRFAHSIHWMQPIRDLLRSHIDIEKIINSQVQLRLGITDVQSGHFFTVTQPDAGFLGTPLEEWGRIEQYDFLPENPEKAMPTVGSNGNPALINLRHAIYASSCMPVYMDPMIADFESTTTHTVAGEAFDRVAMKHPRELLFLVGNPKDKWDALPLAIKTKFEHDYAGLILKHGLEWLIRRPYFIDAIEPYAHIDNPVAIPESRIGTPTGRIWFDGGLRNTAPISDALRLGAKDIYVVSAAPMQHSRWRFDGTGLFEEAEFDLGPMVLMKYLSAAMSTSFHDVAKNDLMTTLAFNEFLGWSHELFNRIDDNTKKVEVSQMFNNYWGEFITPNLRTQFNGSSWLGDKGQFSTPMPLGSDVSNNAIAYGKPFVDEGSNIYSVMPDRSLIGTREFDSGDKIKEAIEQGKQMVQQNIRLISGVPKDVVS